MSCEQHKREAHVLNLRADTQYNQTLGYWEGWKVMVAAVCRDGSAGRWRCWLARLSDWQNTAGANRHPTPATGKQMKEAVNMDPIWSAGTTSRSPSTRQKPVLFGGGESVRG